MFDIHLVDSTKAESLEQLGTKRKFWYKNNDTRTLFKAEERGTGEDWAEKIACELCGLLRLPHVEYDLAKEVPSGTPGVICATCVERGTALVLGNQLLFEQDPDYPATDSRKFKVVQHTVDAVKGVLSGMQRPPEKWCQSLPAGIETALDVFCGYVMLDAWIANQDRHHENWGALRQKTTLWLAPTFDHGACLARNIDDAERKDRMETKDQRRHVKAFAEKARCGFYGSEQGNRSLGTLEAWRAFGQYAPSAADIWLDQLRRIEKDAIVRILDEVPPHRMSRICRDFTLQLLLVNQERLLSGVDK